MTTLQYSILWSIILILALCSTIIQDKFSPAGSHPLRDNTPAGQQQQTWNRNSGERKIALFQSSWRTVYHRKGSPPTKDLRTHLHNHPQTQISLLHVKESDKLLFNGRQTTCGWHYETRRRRIVPFTLCWCGSKANEKIRKDRLGNRIYGHLAVSERASIHVELPATMESKDETSGQRQEHCFEQSMLTGI